MSLFFMPAAFPSLTSLFPSLGYASGQEEYEVQPDYYLSIRSASRNDNR